MFKLILVIAIFIFLFGLFLLLFSFLSRINDSKAYQSIMVTVVACLIFIPPGLYLYRDYYNALTVLYNCIFVTIIISYILIIYFRVCNFIAKKVSCKIYLVRLLLTPILLIGYIFSGIFFVKVYPIVKFQSQWECKQVVTGWKGETSSECNLMF